MSAPRTTVVALAGGVGAGKLLRGLIRLIPQGDVTVIVNTADDIELHGLHVSPDLDSVTYWLAGVADRERGWGRADETFHAIEELRARGVDAWFALGDRDLATHLRRTQLLRGGASLSQATAAITRGFGIDVRVLPMSDDPVTTRLHVTDGEGRSLDLHFQEYWVRRRGADDVKEIRYQGAERSVPAPGVIDAIRRADVVVICPSNPVASILPILAVPGIADAVRERRDRAVGISPIVGGAPLRGMADRLMPVAGLAVSAAGAAAAYAELLGSFLIDERDAPERGRIEAMGLRVGSADTIMVDDDAAARIARAALSLASS